MIRKYEYTILNIIFFLLLLFNNFVIIRFGPDILIHVTIVIVLFLTYREKDRFDKKKYWLISCFSFFIKIFMLIIQCIYINNKLDMKIYIITEVLCSVSAILCESYVRGHIKKIERQSYDDKVFKKKNIDNYYKKKYEEYKLISPVIRFDDKSEIDKKMKRTFMSGFQTIIVALSFIVIYIMQFLNKNIFDERKISIVVMICLLVINLIVLIKALKSNLIISICTCLSLIILYWGEVFFWFKMDDIRVLIWTFSMVFLIPLINEKISIAKEIEIESSIDDKN
ncbi:hypothetical protein SAMN02910289_01891 [Lachnospiraceae bacterium RM5]|nr:hypothetical protein SAMN02910289_01891 [Lachnospiraceae bacterium RM5]